MRPALSLLCASVYTSSLRLDTVILGPVQPPTAQVYFYVPCSTVAFWASTIFTGVMRSLQVILPDQWRDDQHMASKDVRRDRTSTLLDYCT